MVPLRIELCPSVCFVHVPKSKMSLVKRVAGGTFKVEESETHKATTKSK